MTQTFRAAVAVLALAIAPMSAFAQDDGRSFDEQLADQIESACGGGDGGACIALIAQMPANSPLQERALTAAVSSGMTDAQVASVAATARVTPSQAARVATVAAATQRVAPAITQAIQVAVARGANNTPPEVEGSAG